MKNVRFAFFSYVTSIRRQILRIKETTKVVHMASYIEHHHAQVYPVWQHAAYVAQLNFV